MLLVTGKEWIGEGKAGGGEVSKRPSSEMQEQGKRTTR